MSEELFDRLFKRKEKLEKLKSNSYLKQKVIDCINIDNQEDFYNLIEDPFKEKLDIDNRSLKERYDQFIAKYTEELNR